jgi:RNA polymerase sigma factor for flagellar operon FliA
MRIADADMTTVWADYKRAPDRSLRDTLVTKYYPLVRHVAERLSNSLPSFVDVEDLASMGIFGLLDAIERFDPQKGVKFKTYAMNRIRGSILDELRSMDWVPRLVRIKNSRLEQVRQQLEVEHGRKPTFYEMAKQMELSFEDYQSFVEGGLATAMISLSDEWTGQDDSEGNRKIDLVEDDNPTGSPVHEMQLHDIRDVVARQLSEKEKTIVALYYYEGLSMKEIAHVLGLTESRICQIHGKVVRRLQEQLERVKVELFV